MWWCLIRPEWATATIRSQANRPRTSCCPPQPGCCFGRMRAQDAIFTQRASVMLTQLFLAAREEGRAPFPYVRHMIRSGLTSAAERLEAVSPELATQFLDVAFDQANLSDRFLLSAWGTLSANAPAFNQTVIRSLAGSDLRPQSSTRPGRSIFAGPSGTS